jgi:hypothetical protein
VPRCTVSYTFVSVVEPKRILGFWIVDLMFYHAPLRPWYTSKKITLKLFVMLYDDVTCIFPAYVSAYVSCLCKPPRKILVTFTILASIWNIHSCRPCINLKITVSNASVVYCYGWWRIDVCHQFVQSRVLASIWKLITISNASVMYCFEWRRIDVCLYNNLFSHALKLR